MSTIHDALKKVQNDMHPQNNVPVEPASTPQPAHNPFNRPPETPPPDETIEQTEPSSPQKNRRRFFGVILFMIGLCILGFSGTYIIDRMDLFPPKINIPFMKPQPAEVKEQAPTGLKIKGIMSTGGKNVALINNSIYEAGDTVNQMKIISVSKTEVTLTDEQGQEKVLGISK